MKIILAVHALGIFLNAFATPISKEVFGILDAWAATGSIRDPIHISCSGCN